MLEEGPQGTGHACAKGLWQERILNPWTRV